MSCEPEEQLADWRAKTDAATAGPWAITLGMGWGVITDRADEFDEIASVGPEIDEQALPDAEFIAVSRTAMPLLLAAVESVLGLCDEADKRFEKREGLSLLLPHKVRRAITDALNGGGDDAE